jgi:RND family efflux transporter MFP subunit
MSSRQTLADVAAWPLLHALAAACLAACAAAAGAQTPVEGFTEPSRTIEVAAVESGLLAQLHVLEGEQLLGALDDDLQRSQLDIAAHLASLRGKLAAAEAELTLQQRRYDRLLELRQAGQAYAEETARALMDLQVAQGRLLAEQEERKLAQLQLERARLQLKKRSIVAPVDGVVVSLYRQVGEYVSPVAPQVLQLAALHPLRATFLLTPEQLARVKPQQKLRVELIDLGQTAEGVVEMISPVTDAESGTTAVRLRIPNAKLDFRSGERCRLTLP